MSKKLFTIGHSNLSLEDFIALLQKYEVTAIADVRSHPYSRYLPHYLIFYTELEEVIWVIAIAHSKRKPNYWKQRNIEI